ncbi:hypothetical protein HY095_03505 [Candidatus Micrarchaeota archaeon]|nr:hypothetical protein [Candidatus Micrarchaeota archaeon]
MSLHFLAAMNKSRTAEEFIENHLVRGLEGGTPHPTTQRSCSNRYVKKLDGMLRDPEGQGRKLREIMFINRETGGKCLFGIERTVWLDPEIIRNHDGARHTQPFVRLFNNVRLNIPSIDWENCARHTGILRYPHGNLNQSGGERTAGRASGGDSGHPKSVSEAIAIPAGNIAHWPGVRFSANRPELAIAEVGGSAFERLRELGEPMDFLAIYRDSISLLGKNRSAIGYARSFALPEDAKHLFGPSGELKRGIDPLDYFLKRYANYETLVSRLATIATNPKFTERKKIRIMDTELMVEDVSKAISANTGLKGGGADAEANRTFPLMIRNGGAHAKKLAERIKQLLRA